MIGGVIHGAPGVPALPSPEKVNIIAYLKNEHPELLNEGIKEVRAEIDKGKDRKPTFDIDRTGNLRAVINWTIEKKGGGDPIIFRQYYYTSYEAPDETDQKAIEDAQYRLTWQCFAYCEALKRAIMGDAKDPFRMKINDLAKNILFIRIPGAHEHKINAIYINTVDLSDGKLGISEEKSLSIDVRTIMKTDFLKRTIASYLDEESKELQITKVKKEDKGEKRETITKLVSERSLRAEMTPDELVDKLKENANDKKFPSKILGEIKERVEQGEKRMDAAISFYQVEKPVGGLFSREKISDHEFQVRGLQEKQAKLEKEQVKWGKKVDNLGKALEKTKREVKDRVPPEQDERVKEKMAELAKGELKAKEIRKALESVEERLEGMKIEKELTRVALEKDQDSLDTSEDQLRAVLASNISSVVGEMDEEEREDLLGTISGRLDENNDNELEAFGIFTRLMDGDESLYHFLSEKELSGSFDLIFHLFIGHIGEDKMVLQKEMINEIEHIKILKETREKKLAEFKEKVFPEIARRVSESEREARVSGSVGFAGHHSMVDIDDEDEVEERESVSDSRRSSVSSRSSRSSVSSHSSQRMVDNDQDYDSDDDEDRPEASRLSSSSVSSDESGLSDEEILMNAGLAPEEEDDDVDERMKARLFALGGNIEDTRELGKDIGLAEIPKMGIRVPGNDRKLFQSEFFSKLIHSESEAIDYLDDDNKLNGTAILYLNSDSKLMVSVKVDEDKYDHIETADSFSLKGLKEKYHLMLGKEVDEERELDFPVVEAHPSLEIVDDDEEDEDREIDLSESPLRNHFVPSKEEAERLLNIKENKGKIILWKDHKNDEMILSYDEDGEIRHKKLSDNYSEEELIRDYGEKNGDQVVTNFIRKHAAEF